jgi:hypothetical protein
MFHNVTAWFKAASKKAATRNDLPILCLNKRASRLPRWGNVNKKQMGGLAFWQGSTSGIGGSCERGLATMKMIAEHPENAAKFKRMAAQESDPKLKADLEKQAAAYRKLAADRATKQGYKTPPNSN